MYFIVRGRRRGLNGTDQDLISQAPSPSLAASTLPSPNRTKIPDSATKDPVSLNEMLHIAVDSSDAPDVSEGWTVTQQVTVSLDDDFPAVISDTKIIAKVETPTHTTEKTSKITKNNTIAMRKPQLQISTGFRSHAVAPEVSEMTSPKTAPVVSITNDYQFKNDVPKTAPATTSRNFLGSRVAVQRGQITQRGLPFQGLPVPPPSAAIDSALETKRTQLSFMNTVISSGQHNATIKDWEKMSAVNEKSPTRTQDSITESDEPWYYTAMFFATDNDFLNQYQSRLIFRENALHPDDAVLPVLPNTSDTENQPVQASPQTEATCCIIFLQEPTSEQLANTSPCMRSCYTFRFQILFACTSLTVLVFVICVLAIARI